MNHSDQNQSGDRKMTKTDAIDTLKVVADRLYRIGESNKDDAVHQSETVREEIQRLSFLISKCASALSKEAK